MENEKSKRNNFIAYEYKAVKADSDQASMLLDGYENFGWLPDENFGGTGNSTEQGKKVIRMKRDRKIMNKAELTRLQRNFETCIGQISALENSKKSTALTAALIAGGIGTAFMAGSTFAVTAQTPHMIMGIILAIPGFIGWILPYFVYRGMVKKQTEKVTPLIEEKYDEIYELCEKGNRLLN